MSMGHLCAIPVDTHVFQIAARDYLPHLRSCKTVTDKVYQEIANHFRGVFGEYAGWAHSVSHSFYSHLIDILSSLIISAVDYLDFRFDFSWSYVYRLWSVSKALPTLYSYLMIC